MPMLPCVANLAGQQNFVHSGNDGKRHATLRQQLAQLRTFLMLQASVQSQNYIVLFGGRTCLKGFHELRQVG